MTHKILIVLFVFLAATTLTAADADFKTAVDAGVKEFTNALKTKDVAAMSGVYASDAILYPPNAEAVQGREAIGAFWKNLMDAGMTGELETVETQEAGDLGLETGKFRILSADGKEVDRGKYVVVWKKENGAWKLYRDIWNSSLPAPGATAPSN